MAEQERGEGIPRKREFILAMSIFVAMAVVGTAFGLWYMSSLLPPSRAMEMTTPAR